jgi:hypothetical protein
MPLCCAAMKIGQWESLGRARALLQKQLGQLGTLEYASYVSVNQDNGRLRILVASDVGLIDYSYAPMTPNPEADWILRGQVLKWAQVRGLRLATDGQLNEEGEDSRSVWRFLCEEPRIELSASHEDGDPAIEALLAFARACFQNST